MKLTKEASIPGKHPSMFPCLRDCDAAAAWLTLLSPAHCTCTFPHIVRKETNELESNNSSPLFVSPRSGQGHGIKSRT